MSYDCLPPLPPTEYVLGIEGGGYNGVDRCSIWPAWNDDAMHAYARAANAPLIATVTDLRAALQDLVDAMTGRMDGETVALHNALVALRKAGNGGEGEK
jgi:hypothetical protein